VDASSIKILQNVKEKLQNASLLILIVLQNITSANYSHQVHFANDVRTIAQNLNAKIHVLKNVLYV